MIKIYITVIAVRSFNDLPSSINNSWRIWQNGAAISAISKAKKGSILPSIEEEEKKKNCLPSAVAGGGWNEHVSWLQFGILHYIAQCNVLTSFSSCFNAVHLISSLVLLKIS